MPDPQDSRGTTATAPPDRATGGRATGFTVDKAATLSNRISTPGPAPGGPWPRIHEDVLKALVSIAKRHPTDGDDRVPDLLALAQSIPADARPGLYSRLTPQESRDAFAVYFRQNFPTTRDIFLRALSGEPPPPPAAAKGTAAPARASSEFVTERYGDIKADPMYIDNFTNDVGDAWLPNDRAFIFEYPGGVLLLVGLADLIKAINLKSELNPQPSAEDLRKKYHIPADVDLPESTSQTPFITVGGVTRFYRDSQTRVIYPTGSPIARTYLPRISSVVSEIEKTRADRELVQRALIPILGRIVAMEWSAPRGFGALIVRIARGVAKLGRAVAPGVLRAIVPKGPASPGVPVHGSEPAVRVPENETPGTGRTRSPEPSAPEDPDATPPLGVTRSGKPVIRIDRPQIEVGPDQIKVTWTGDPKAVVMFKEVGEGIEISYINAGAQSGQGPLLFANAVRKASQQLGRPKLAQPRFLQSDNVINKTTKDLIESGRIEEAKVILRRSALFYARALGGNPGTVELVKSGDKIVSRVSLTY